MSCLGSGTISLSDDAAEAVELIAEAGDSELASRSDHVHDFDPNTLGVPDPFTGTPAIVASVSSVGASDDYARGDHAHGDRSVIYTPLLNTKLLSIAEDAEVNVQSDWAQMNAVVDSFIQNKPTIPPPYIHTQSDWNEADTTSEAYIDNKPITITTAQITTIDSVEDDAQVNVQSDWDEIDTQADAFILNKPTDFGIDGAVWVADSDVGGTGEAITLTPTPAITSYEVGQRYIFRVQLDSSAAVTVAVSGLTPLEFRINGNQADDGDLLTDLIYEIVYDGTAFEVVNHGFNSAGGVIINNIMSLLFADAINTSSASFSGLLSSADLDVQAALETLDAVNAGSIDVDVTNISRILNASDTTIQAVLDRIDNLVIESLPIDDSVFTNNLSTTGSGNDPLTNSATNPSGPLNTIGTILRRIDALETEQRADEVPLMGTYMRHFLGSTTAEDVLALIDEWDSEDIGINSSFTGALASVNSIVEDQYSVADALEVIDGFSFTGTDDQTAAEVDTSTTNFTEFLSAGPLTVQAALDILDDINAGSVGVDVAGFNGNLSSSDTTVQTALSTLDSAMSMGGTDDQTASEVTATTTDFAGVLSVTENTVQKALDAIDDVVAGDIPTSITNFGTNITTNAMTVQAALDEVNTLTLGAGGTFETLTDTDADFSAGVTGQVPFLNASDKLALGDLTVTVTQTADAVTVTVTVE